MRHAVLLICVLVAAGVFAAMFVALWRSNRAALPRPALHRGLMVELIWAMIPCLIFAMAATPAVITVVNQR